jgi:hypothetical protein
VLHGKGATPQRPTASTAAFAAAFTGKPRASDPLRRLWGAPATRARRLCSLKALFSRQGFLPLNAGAIMRGALKEKLVGCLTERQVFALLEAVATRRAYALIRLL